MGKIRHPFETPPENGTALEIADGVLWMRLPLPMALDHVNVYALREGDGWVIVDTGFFSKKGTETWKALIEGPLQGGQIKCVLLTHHHPDHVGAVGWFMKEYGAELITSRTAYLLSRMLILDEQETLPEEVMDYYWKHGIPKEVYEARAKSRPFNFADTVHPLPIGYTRIQDGDQIQLGDRHWDVLRGDGHAPEHLLLMSRDDDLLLAGDQIIPGISSNISIHPTEPMADPLGEWLESCERLREIVRDDQFILPGHKLPFYGAKERLTQLLTHHAGGLSRMVEMMDKPRLPIEFFDTLFMRKVSDLEFGFAFGETLAHLRHLEETGKINREMHKDGQYRWLKI